MGAESWKGGQEERIGRGVAGIRSVGEWARRVGREGRRNGAAGGAGDSIGGGMGAKSWKGGRRGTEREGVRQRFDGWGNGREVMEGRAE
jgi:hypothetical protein